MFNKHVGKFELFTLSDPRDSVVWWVGVRADTAGMEKGGRWPANQDLQLWVQELETVGLKPKVVVLDKLGPRARRKRLQKQIAWERRHGARLLNVRGAGRRLERVRLTRVVLGVERRVYGRWLESARREGLSLQSWITARVEREVDVAAPVPTLPANDLPPGLKPNDMWCDECDVRVFERERCRCE